MSTMSKLADTLTRLANGEPVTSAERGNVRAYLDHLDREDMAHWREAGRKAYANGEPHAPSLNAAVRAAIDGLPVGGGAAEIMRAFSEGWMRANMAEGFPKPISKPIPFSQ